VADQSDVPGEVGAEDEGERDLPLDTIISRRLMQDIIGGVYPPGHWIREQEVASRYGTSRTPVRNAFRQVERQGFILVRPWRGAKVLELSADDTRYILDMLEAVYGVAMRIAAETVDESHFPELEIMYQRALDAVSRNSLPERIDIAFQTGRRLSRWSGSSLAHDMLNRVGSLALWQHRFLDFDVPAAAQRQVELHRTLIDAVMTRNSALAESSAREIVALTKSFLVPRVRLQNDTTQPSRTRRARQKRAPG
jgi:GntR family transcriptional regulator, rspAB operon transcriptional repressor